MPQILLKLKENIRWEIIIYVNRLQRFMDTMHIRTADHIENVNGNLSNVIFKT